MFAPVILSDANKRVHFTTTAEPPLMGSHSARTCVTEGFPVAMMRVMTIMLGIIMFMVIFLQTHNAIPR